MSRGKVAGCPYQKLRPLQKNPSFLDSGLNLISAGVDLRRYQLQLRTGGASCAATAEAEVFHITRLIGLKSKMPANDPLAALQVSQLSVKIDLSAQSPFCDVRSPVSNPGADSHQAVAPSSC